VEGQVRRLTHAASRRHLRQRWGHRLDEWNFTQHSADVASCTAVFKGNALSDRPKELTIQVAGNAVPARACEACSGTGFLARDEPITRQYFSLKEGRPNI